MFLAKNKFPPRKFVLKIPELIISDSRPIAYRASSGNIFYVCRNVFLPEASKAYTGLPF